MSSNSSASSQKTGFAMNMNGSNKKLPLGSKPRTPFAGNRTRVALADDSDDDDDQDDEYTGRQRRQGGRNDRVELLHGFENNKATDTSGKHRLEGLGKAEEGTL
ncbi:hypothetical protein [Absidia glauca]|uniref:Uncharacterized protein n=1 Tax=Absidia glauca TaxID=4829 RepID=A0A163K5Z9_ABSGL|nr:hypothetical protein [Absidia glauca]